ncbi:hypothetical protein CEXT_452281 [Caerostris extrusa]|uniref:Uncharacterized protein n=1 Tax=Caerostris extrusa TaxID=172846 RepID=A0AAV4YCS4_CAEEX|nr:hypothetical protein CEXT_452281 [Caerostris extrusa]
MTSYVSESIGQSSTLTAFSQSNTASQRNSMRTYVSTQTSSKASGKKVQLFVAKNAIALSGLLSDPGKSIGESATSYRIRNASLYPDATNPMQMIRPFNNFGCSIRGYGCRLDCIDLLNVDMGMESYSAEA